MIKLVLLLLLLASCAPEQFQPPISHPTPEEKWREINGPDFKTCAVWKKIKSNHWILVNSDGGIVGTAKVYYGDEHWTIFRKNGSAPVPYEFLTEASAKKALINDKQNGYTECSTKVEAENVKASGNK